MSYIIDKVPEEDVINMLREELITFVSMLNTDSQDFFKSIEIVLNPIKYYNPKSKINKSMLIVQEWWKTRNTKEHLLNFLRSKTHQVNGKFGQWSSGTLGSRWADCEINKMSCRIAFYSRKNNPTWFENKIPNDYNYLLIIDPKIDELFDLMDDENLTKEYNEQIKKQVKDYEEQQVKDYEEQQVKDYEEQQVKDYFEQQVKEIISVLKQVEDEELIPKFEITLKLAESVLIVILNQI